MDWWFLRRRRAFMALFGDDKHALADAARTVLTDLAGFCNQTKPSIRMSDQGTIDPLAMAVAEGRREVYLRIMAFSNLNDRDIRRIIEEETEQ